MRALILARNLVARAVRITKLESRVADLEVWLEKAEAAHTEAVAENNGLRLYIAKRGCCKVDGGEDAIRPS